MSTLRILQHVLKTSYRENMHKVSLLNKRHLSTEQLGSTKPRVYKPIDSVQGPCGTLKFDQELRKKMPCIQAIGKCYPKYLATKEHLEKTYCSDKFEYDEETKDWMAKVIKRSAIDTIPYGIDLSQFYEEAIPYDSSIPVDEHNLYRRAEDPWCPTTHERSQVFEKVATELVIGAADNVIREWGGDPKTITHVITNTSTGKTTNGLDLAVVDVLGLTNVRHRLEVDNSGCYGVFSALSVAQAFCVAEPDAVVLVVSVEIMSAHLMKQSKERNDLLINLIVGDGASSAILSAGKKGDWQMSPVRMVTGSPSSRDIVTMSVSDYGYRVKLGTDVAPFLHEFLKSTWRDMIKDAVDVTDSYGCDWAVHPGGKAILNVFHSEDLMNLSKEDLYESWEYLRRHGHTGAIGILPVTKAVLENTTQNGKDKVFCIGFGGGMTAKYFGLTRKI